MVRPRPAVHRTILVVDVEGFGDRRRTNPHQIAVRDGLYRALHQALDNAGIVSAGIQYEDRGDGVFVLAPADVPKSLFVEALPGLLAAALREHNLTHRAEERIRLRMAVHAGEINYDDHGATAAAINLTFRLLDAQPLKAALADSPGVLALIASSWFFDEVVRHSPRVNAASYRPVRVAVKETTVVAWVCLPDHHLVDTVFRPPELETPVPRQLPAHTPHFVGRAEELRQLTELLDTTTRSGDTVVISAINGTAGIGKTVLAVHWACQAADRFPDGQLYVNLRGFDSSASPMSPADAIRGFLDALEIPPERIPVNLDAQAALYRSLLAGRRVLVVLDNARDVDQVRPLLPGSSSCRVVITSRDQLAGLVTREGARPITLDVLSVQEARTLVARTVGPDRVVAEPDVVAEMIEHCARLPLALAIVAARGALNPNLPLRVLTDELRNEQVRLDALDAGDSAASVRAVFSWSYQHLSPPAARMFRLLGVHPGPDISLPAAASLAGTGPRQARAAMAELTRAHLASQHSPGRFAFHDLLRVYAMEQADSADSADDRGPVTRRVLDHYLHTARVAALRAYPRRDVISLTAPESGVTAETFTDCEAAWAWFDVEYPVLLAAIKLAAATRHGTHTWQLPCVLGEFFERRGHWHDWSAVMHLALAVAAGHADRPGQAHVHIGAGRSCLWLGKHDEGATHFREALNLFEEIGDEIGQAHTHLDIAGMYEDQNRQQESLIHAQRALALSPATGSLLARARALDDIGWFHTLLGHHRLALDYCQRAITLCRQLGDRRSESHTLDSLGYARHHLGDYAEAVQCYRRSLALKRELGDRYGEATTLTHLGDTHHATGDVAAARGAWQQGLQILDHLGTPRRASLGYPDIDQIRAQLADVDRAVPR